MARPDDFLPGAAARQKRVARAMLRSMRVSLLIPCYVDLYYPRIGICVVEILERLGHQVEYPQEFTCCGQPPFNAGCSADAAAVARDTLRHFKQAEAVVVPSGSCATMLRVFYRELFANAPEALEAARVLASKTFEFSEFLVERLGVEDVGAVFPGRATFHDGCHGLRELGIKAAPRRLLAQVQGLELVEMDEAETCCGFGGTFAVKFPQISLAMAGVKQASLRRANVEMLISNDPSCLLHLQGYFEGAGRTSTSVSEVSKPPACLHLAEVLARQG